MLWVMEWSHGRVMGHGVGSEGVCSEGPVGSEVPGGMGSRQPFWRRCRGELEKEVEEVEEADEDDDENQVG